MRYEIELAPTAVDDVSKLEPALQSKLLDALEELGGDPVGLSKPSHFPYLPQFQLFERHIDCEGTTHFFAVLFKYAQSETAIWIYGFHHAVIGPSGTE